jgi:hypothetical protein
VSINFEKTSGRFSFVPVYIRIGVVSIIGPGPEQNLIAFKSNLHPGLPDKITPLFPPILFFRTESPDSARCQDLTDPSGNTENRVQLKKVNYSPMNYFVKKVAFAG